jgi:hypothetical protein
MKREADMKIASFFEAGFPTITGVDQVFGVSCVKRMLSNRKCCSAAWCSIQICSTYRYSTH